MKKMRRKVTPTPLVLAALVACILTLQGTATADSTAEMAAQIARLRTEVEELAAEVEAKKEDLRGQLRSYAAQKADVQMELQRAEMAIKQLREARSRRVAEIERDAEREVVLKPAVLAGIERIKQKVLAGLPFKRDERIADLDQLARQMDDGLLRPTDGVARLWDRIEDELRLARENGIYRQVIQLDGQELLVDVARLGMVAMYFKTKDGRVGRTVRSGGSWTYQTIATKQHKEQVLGLFDSFKKQIRVGFFVLPNPLPEGSN